MEEVHFESNPLAPTATERIIHTPIHFKNPIDAYHTRRQPNEFLDSRVIEFYAQRQLYVVEVPTERIIVTTFYLPHSLYILGVLGVVRTPLGDEPELFIGNLDEVDLERIGNLQYTRSIEDAVAKHLKLVEKIEMVFAPHAEISPTTYTYLFNQLYQQNVSSSER